jgi:dihydroorotate dehydrogenase (fumarate)
MDLSTRYLGLTLKHPIVPSSSPLTSNLDGIRRLEDAGAAAVVLVSLFEEHITKENQFLDYYLSYGIDSYEEALLTLPDLSPESGSIGQYLELIRQAKKAVEIPIIASLNGISTGGWTRYAQEIEKAGADALELNVYYLPTNLELSGSDVEATYFQVLRDVKEVISIPLAMKLSPFFSAPGHMALRLAKAGAGGLVLFNRFYQPDFNLETRKVNLELALSRSYEMRLPLRWVAILYGRISADLAITGGIHSYRDVLKAVMAGSKAAMVTSELLQQGPRRIGEMLEEITRWLEAQGHESLSEIQGVMSQLKASEPKAFERANYIRMLQS